MGAKAGSKRSRSAAKGPPAKKAKTPAKKAKKAKAPAAKKAAAKQKTTKKTKAKATPKATVAKATKVTKAKPTPKPAAKAKAAASTSKATAKTAPAKPAPAKKSPPAGPAVPLPSGKLSDDNKLKHWRALNSVASSGTKISALDLEPFTMKDLKQALKHNDRSTTGNRGDLTKAIVDNMTNGCPPRCPKCGGGRLRYGKKEGKDQYFCPGYMEDDEFVNCSFRGADGSVTRIPWKSL